MLRPSAERVAALGGLHAFMRWPYPILTDSGGFQVMSLAALRKVEEEGVTFRSHLDGAMIELTPERAIEVQILLGSDIAMQLDECVRLPAERSEIERAMNFSLRWAERCKRAFEKAASAKRCSASCRAATIRIYARQRARARRYRLRRLCARRPRRWRNPGRDAQGGWRDRADAARRQAALSHGRRHAGRHSRSDRPRHRHVRLRLADAQRASRIGVHALVRSTSRTPTMPRIRGRSMRRAGVLRRATFPAPICITCSAPARRLGHAVVDRQSLLLPGLDAGAHAPSRPGVLPISGANPRAMGRQRRPAGIVTDARGGRNVQRQRASGGE